MYTRGIILVVLLLAAPLYWFLPLAGSYRPSAVFSQYLGVAAIVAMALAQLMATRLPWLETAFGGLDRIYVLHKWLGIGALAAVLLHDAVGAEIKGVLGSSVFGEIGEDLGEIAYNGFIVLVGLTVLTFVPYRWWAWSHKLIGIFFLVSVAHFLLVAKPFALTDPVALYVLAFCAVGSASYIYNVVPFGRDGRNFAYEIASMEPTGGALAVTLKPRRRALRHLAGQFAFVRFDAPGMVEQHPFTISSCPREDGSLRFTIKPLGDFTAKLGACLQPGMGAHIAGPFGRFLRRGTAGQEIWIAGGVGVTPFVAWAEALREPGPRIHMIYAVRSESEAPHLPALRDIASRRSEFTLQVLESSQGQRLNASTVAHAVQGDARSTHIYLCGPEGLRRIAREAMASKGVPLRNLHHEEFEIRTGIGLEPLFSRMMRRLKPKAA